jgi:hypothetical protein
MAGGGQVGVVGKLLTQDFSRQARHARSEEGAYTSM